MYRAKETFVVSLMSSQHLCTTIGGMQSVGGATGIQLVARNR